MLNFWLKYVYVIFPVFFKLGMNQPKVETIDEDTKNQIQDLIKQIQENQCNTHVYFPILNFYAIDKLRLCIRCTRRTFFFSGVETKYNTLEIVQIEVPKEHQQQGICSYFITEFEKLALKNGRKVYVECVLNPILANHLVKRGYNLYNEDCYIN